MSGFDGTFWLGHSADYARFLGNCQGVGFRVESVKIERSEFMSTTTLREPKAKRRRSNPAPQKNVEGVELLTPMEKFQRLGREIAEWRESQGFTEEDELTMDEIVAIIKEARVM